MFFTNAEINLTTFFKIPDGTKISSNTIVITLSLVLLYVTAHLYLQRDIIRALDKSSRFAKLLDATTSEGKSNLEKAVDGILAISRIDEHSYVSKIDSARIQLQDLISKYEDVSKKNPKTIELQSFIDNTWDFYSIVNNLKVSLENSYSSHELNKASKPHEEIYKDRFESLFSQLKNICLKLDDVKQKNFYDERGNFNLWDSELKMAIQEFRDLHKSSEDARDAALEAIRAAPKSDIVRHIATEVDQLFGKADSDKIRVTNIFQIWCPVMTGLTTSWVAIFGTLLKLY